MKNILSRFTAFSQDVHDHNQRAFSNSLPPAMPGRNFLVKYMGTPTPISSLPEDTTITGSSAISPDDAGRIKRILSSEDTLRLLNMQAIYVSNQGQLLAFSDEDKKFTLVDTIGNGFVPPRAMFPSPYSNHKWCEAFKPVTDDYVRGELSAELSKYIWPLDRDVIHVQLRSSVPQVSHSFCEVNVVFGNNGGDDGGGFCLVARGDGRVKWLPQSKYDNRNNHVWTVHLFDPPSRGEVHLCQRLRRRGAISDSNRVNVINNNNFGGNRNESGSQFIGTINYQTDLHLNLPRTNLE